MLIDIGFLGEEEILLTVAKIAYQRSCFSSIVVADESVGVPGCV